MAELVQLDRHYEDFAGRGTRVVAASMEGLDEARKTQSGFPHLIVLADESRGLSQAASVIHPHAGPDKADIDVPTTILIDGRGIVRWIYRSPNVIVRLSPEDVVRAIDRELR